MSVLSGNCSVRVTQEAVTLTQEYTAVLEVPKEGKRITATCKWFNDAKGYGFLFIDGAGEDAFVHYSNINTAPGSYKTIPEGATVTALLFKNDKGRLEARDVTAIPQGVDVKPIPESVDIRVRPQDTDVNSDSQPC